MAVATGQPLGDLLDLDPAWAHSLAEAYAERRDSWSFEREMLASLLELLSVMRLEALARYTKPGTRLPEPIRVRRPWMPDEPEEDVVPVITPRQFALMTG